MNISVREAQRQHVLDRLELLDTPHEPEFDAIAARAAEVCAAPIAFVSLVDRDRQFFKARVGFEGTETPRAGSFCSYAIREDGPFIVPDARRDPRFSTHPLVRGEAGIVFYAAVPLVSAGEAIGTLCVLDSRPRELETEALAELQELAREAVRRFEARRARILEERLTEIFEREARPALLDVSRGLAEILGKSPTRAAALATTRLLERVAAADRALDEARDVLAASSPLREPSRTRWDLFSLLRAAAEDAGAAGLRPIDLVLDGEGVGEFVEQLGDRLSRILVELGSKGSGPLLIRGLGAAASVALLIEDPSWEPGPRARIAPRDSRERILGSLEVCLRAHRGELEVRVSNGTTLELCVPRR